jgi:hypothetical protein
LKGQKYAPLFYLGFGSFFCLNYDIIPCYIKKPDLKFDF